MDELAGRVTDARFSTNGCGFMVAASDVLCDWLKGKSLVDMQGLDGDELKQIVSLELGAFPSEREKCGEIALEALRNAMAKYRARRIDEYRGEQALICTCFGVSEETIVNAIAAHEIKGVEGVSTVCRAGSGCGSCRMLIAELIESAEPAGQADPRHES
jgi:NifU-like protein